LSILSRVRAGWRGFWATQDTKEGWIPVSGGNEFDPSNQSEEKFLALSAYFACVRNISEDVGKLPFILYKRLERGKERATDHKYYNMIRYRPAVPISSAALRETVTRYALAWGNGYARIYRTNGDDVGAIMPLHPQNVKVKSDGQGGVNYEYKRGTNDPVTIQGRDMIHVHGVGSNGVSGMSVAAYGVTSMTMAAAIKRFGTNLYTTNGRPGGILKTSAKLTKEARSANVEAWAKAHSGERMGGTAMLDNGIDYSPITVNPNDAQYIETCNFTVEDVARWFRMPLHKIQYLVRAQGWSTLDAQNTDYLTDTLMPWLARIEQEFTYKLIGTHDEYFCEHMVDGILRGDVSTRADYYVKQFSIGALSINEIRDMENRNPIEEEGGDKHFVPMNMTPAEFANSVSGGKSGGQGE